MAVYSLFILNKAGGLIFYRDFNSKLNNLSSNDSLIFAGTFHGVHAISAKVSPVGHSSGVQVFQTSKFVLYCLQTLTGIKFLVIVEPRQVNTPAILEKIYELYADYVLKNPFYQLDMPIRCDSFDEMLNTYIKSI